MPMIHVVKVDTAVKYRINSGTLRESRSARWSRYA